MGLYQGLFRKETSTYDQQSHADAVSPVCARSWLAFVEGAYSPHANYHNATHAADVLQVGGGVGV